MASKTKAGEQAGPRPSNTKVRGGISPSWIFAISVSGLIVSLLVMFPPRHALLGNVAYIERVTDQLETPEFDDRQYRVIRLLPNKMEALLVHDPDTDRSSASLNVNVGSFSDPDDLPGLAHMVEHMLFMGSEKYPKENGYFEFMKAHSGYANAYTTDTETNYFFEVASCQNLTNGSQISPLYSALDRLAQFFTSPLFLSSSVEREIRAVDSENSKNLQNDYWRLRQLDRSLSNPKHPYHRFSTGNIKTLRDRPRERGVDLLDAIMKFHGEHYSANRMKLVVLGKESLNQLEAWVSVLFGAVQNKDLPQNRWDREEPYRGQEVSIKSFARPVMDIRFLEIIFPFQDEDNMYETKPSRYIGHLIGHEGPGSIHAYLKAKGWADSLWCGYQHLCPGSAFLKIRLQLTKDGLKHYEDIIKVVFQYISLIKETPPQRWIMDEIKTMAEVDFRFQQKESASAFSSRHSSIMQKPLPREWLLSGSTLIRKFDPTSINEALSFLRTDNYRLIIAGQDFPGNWNQKEAWYGTQYRSEPIPSKFSEDVETASFIRPKELCLPKKNVFIPTRLNIERKEVDAPLTAPKLIRNDDGIRTWWKKDDRFWVPRTNLLVVLRTPLVEATPANAVKTAFYCELVKDALNEFAYDADISGLKFNLQSSPRGVEISIHGYSDKMSVLLMKVMSGLRDLDIKQDMFEIVKERLLREYENWGFQEPFRQIQDLESWFLTEGGWLKEQYLAEIPDMTATNVSASYLAMLHQIHIEVLMHGDLCKEDALRISDLIESTLNPRPLPQTQWQTKRSLVLSEGSDSTYEHTLDDPENSNHCIDYYLHIGSTTDYEMRARLLLLVQMTSEPAFSQLRTKEQLGYIVFTEARMGITSMGYRIIVQSERPAAYLEQRINSFLASFFDSLKAISDEAFEIHKLSLISERLEKYKNLDQETGAFWQRISSEDFDFLQFEKDAAHIKTLEKADIIDFFGHYIQPNSAARAKLSIHMVARKAGHGNAQSMNKDQLPFNTSSSSEFPSAQLIKEPSFIRNIYEYKARLAASPTDWPMTNLQEFEDL